MSRPDIQARLELSLRYERRALDYQANSAELLRRGELAKAGEMLWGAFVSYLNAIAVLLRGEPLRGHGEVRRLGRQVAIARGDRELHEYITTAEAMHANFYHEFMGKEEFMEYYGRALRALASLRQTFIELREAILSQA